jgi:hypothetical protein
MTIRRAGVGAPAFVTVPQKVLIIASHNCHKLRQLQKNQADAHDFSSISAAVCLELLYFVLADEFRFHHIVAARYRDL